MSVLKEEAPRALNINSEFLRKEQQRFRVKMGVFLVLIDNGRVLCLRRANTGIEDGLYVVPMGGVQEGETPLEAVIRESFEEVGVIIDPQDLTLAHLMYRKHIQPDGYFFYQQDIFFVTRRYKGEISNKEPHKADEVAFFPLDELPQNFSPCVRKALECLVNDVTYSEFGHEEACANSKKVQA